jgi:hypothetical protein
MAWPATDFTSRPFDKVASDLAALCLAVNEREAALGQPESRFTIPLKTWASGVNYEIGDSVTGTDGNVYLSKTDHTSSSTNKPITGASYSTDWAREDGETWVTATSYVVEDRVIGTNPLGGQEGIYRCILAHTSSIDKRPFDGANYKDYWTIGRGQKPNPTTAEFAGFVLGGNAQANKLNDAIIDVQDAVKYLVENNDREKFTTTSGGSTLWTHDDIINDIDITILKSNKPITGNESLGYWEKIENWAVDTEYRERAAVRGTDGDIYVAKLEHTSVAAEEPITGGIYEQKWTPRTGLTWTTATNYAVNERVIGTSGPAFRCIQGHLSDSGNRPVTGVDWEDYWDSPRISMSLTWENNRSYDLDDIKTGTDTNDYVCKVPHTSIEGKDFNSDFNWWDSNVWERLRQYLDKLLYVIIGPERSASSKERTAGNDGGADQIEEAWDNTKVATPSTNTRDESFWLVGDSGNPTGFIYDDCDLTFETSKYSGSVIGTGTFNYNTYKTGGYLSITVTISFDGTNRSITDSSQPSGTQSTSVSVSTDEVINVSFVTAEPATWPIKVSSTNPTSQLGSVGGEVPDLTTPSGLTNDGLKFWLDISGELTDQA